MHSKLIVFYVLKIHLYDHTRFFCIYYLDLFNKKQPLVNIMHVYNVHTVIFYLLCFRSM